MGRGGKRAGAGRPAPPEDERRRRYLGRVLPCTDDYLRELAEREGLTLGEALDLVVDMIAAQQTSMRPRSNTK